MESGQGDELEDHPDEGEGHAAHRRSGQGSENGSISTFYRNSSKNKDNFNNTLKLVFNFKMIKLFGTLEQSNL